MDCYWCYWGWPSQIAEIYDRALAKLDGDETLLNFGPAHIVWEDENWGSAQYCLDGFDKWVAKHRHQFDELSLEVVKQSLVELLAVPECFKCEPANYPGRDPAKYPPPSGWQMVNK